MASHPAEQRSLPPSQGSSMLLGAADASSDTGPATSPSSGHEASLSPPSSTTNNATPSHPTMAATRIRRRNRMITSCLECRRRKLKCDKSHPCINCTKFKRDCVFLSKDMDAASQLKLTEIKEKVGSLERLLEKDVARVTGVDLAAEQDEHDNLPAADDEKDLEPSPWGMNETAYEEDAGNDDDILDLGVQIGRMRITERIGGFVRPKMSEELKFTSLMARGSFASEPPKSENDDSEEAYYSFLRPGASYIAPASGFLFGQAGTAGSTLYDFLPSRLAADRLIKQYFLAVHPIARTTHQPSFEKDYDAFWEDVALGIEPPASLQSVVFAAMFSGAVSMDEAVVSRDFGASKQTLVDNFKLGTEMALGRAHFLRTTRLSTLQGFVMYLIPLCRAEISRAHSVLVGAAIRLAECMSLHRDGDNFDMNPLETQVRRLIWYQLCFLDLRTCEAQGPRPSIRRDDYDTKLPLNVEDVELHPDGKPPAVSDRFTGATYSLIRFECLEMMRTIGVDLTRVAARKLSLTALLTKIEDFKKKMAAKYDGLMDERIPVQRATKIMKACLCARFNVAALHRYHNSVKNGMPHRLRLVLLASSITFLETGIALETIPELAPWKWYVGAYTQYHIALLLLIDPLQYGNAIEADRIWPCLDYVFGTDRTRPREEKSKLIMDEIQGKLAVYEKRRKLRSTANVERQMSVVSPLLSSVDAGRRPSRESNESSPMSFASSEMPPPMVGRVSMQVPATVTSLAGTSPSEAWPVGLQNQFPRMGSMDSSIGGSVGGNNDGSYGHVGSVKLAGPSMMGMGPVGMAAGAGAIGGQGDDLMAEIDWDAFDALFPPDQAMNDLFPADFSATAMPFTY